METERQETIRVLMGTFKRLQHGVHQNMYRNMNPKLKPSHVFVMMRLRRSARNGTEGIRVSEIASSMGISVPGVTQILTGLEKDGFIRREMDPSDRRGVRVFLTPEGEKMMEPAFQHLEERFNGLIEHLGVENSRTLASLLVEVEKYFSKDNGNGESSDCGQ